MALEVVGSSPTTHPIYFPKALFAQDWGVAKRLRPRILIPVYAGSNPATPAKYDPLAQSVEHLTFNQGVLSSNLRRVTIFAFAAQIAGVAELADALDLGSSAAQAYEFKSLRPHQKQNIMRV